MVPAPLRICYLILAHHKFDQALRLVERLAGPESSFVFHIDSAANSAGVADFRERLERFERVRYAQRVSSAWGAYHQALAVMRCVQAALELMQPCDRYVLLSGQDYPIKGRQHILEFFDNHPDTEFIEAFPLDVMDAGSPGWSPYYRFRRYHFWIGDHHFTVPFVRKGAPPIPIHHGSTWWALTRDAVAYIAQQFDTNVELRRYLRSGFLVDEVYVPSLLMASRFSAKISGNNVTFAQWTPTSGPHPKTLRVDDLEQLLASPKLFARKFDASVDGKLMDELDALHAEDATQQSIRAARPS